MLSFVHCVQTPELGVRNRPHLLPQTPALVTVWPLLLARSMGNFCSFWAKHSSRGKAGSNIHKPCHQAMSPPCRLFSLTNMPWQPNRSWWTTPMPKKHPLGGFILPDSQIHYTLQLSQGCLCWGLWMVWKGCTAVSALQVWKIFWGRGASGRPEKLLCKGERSEVSCPRLVQNAFPCPGTTAVWWRQMLFLHSSDEVSVLVTPMGRNNCFIKHYSYSLGDNFQPISTLHSLTSRVLYAMAIHPGIIWTGMVEKSFLPCHLSHCTFFAILHVGQSKIILLC